MADTFYGGAWVACDGTDKAIYTVPASTTLANAYVHVANGDTVNTEDAVALVSDTVAARRAGKRTLAPGDGDIIWLGHLPTGYIVQVNATADVAARVSGVAVT